MTVNRDDLPVPGVDMASGASAAEEESAPGLQKNRNALSIYLDRSAVPHSECGSDSGNLGRERYSMRWILTVLTVLGCWNGLALGQASRVRVLPAEIALGGTRLSQRVLVVSELNGAVTADQTGRARLVSSRPGVVTVVGNTLQAVADGEAEILATVDGKEARAQVKVTGMGEPARWSFSNHVIPILTRIGCNSGACHGALAGKGGLKLSLRGYNPEADHFVLTRQALGRRVNLQQPEKSLLLLKPAMALNHGGGLKLETTSPEYRILAEWIAAGAPGPHKEEPQVQRLEVLPTQAVLRPKETLPIVVRAWYSDGSAGDVTPWAKYNSSEDLVATVDGDGKATVAGHGEAAITVWYSNLVAAARIASPLPDPVDPQVFAAAERRNFIDRLVLQKLESLRLPPSPLCNDSEFIRRAFLDATGTLPTPEEVQKFLADRSADKRDRLIDALLERTEYVDYWSYKWSDLMLITTKRLPQPAVWSFYQWVRQSVADNKPWDRFAREVLTVNGSTLQNGSANYFLLHKDVTDLTEATSVKFLGMSITCARCHNHPLEKWTQDQYWSLANLFARVGLKNGDRPGDVIVQSLPEGDVLHPRRGVAMMPTPLDGKPLPLDSVVDRRRYFVDWLTSEDNPYFARALVNRVWRNFLGRGLVEAEDDIRQTNPPSNAELLDALAQEFVAKGYDVKQLIGTIMRSATYQRSSLALPGNSGDDRYYSHYLIRRLPAEVILDAYSQVTGVPTAFTQIKSGGSDSVAAYTGYPLGTRALQLPDSKVVSQFLDAFGRPDRSQACSCDRQADSSVGQALHVNNGQTLNDKLRAKNCRIEAWSSEQVADAEAVRRVYMLGLSREPTAAELRKFTGFLAEAATDGKTNRREALEDLFWAVLTSKEFLFNR